MLFYVLCKSISSISDIEITKFGITDIVPEGISFPK